MHISVATYIYIYIYIYIHTYILYIYIYLCLVYFPMFPMQYKKHPITIMAFQRNLFIVKTFLFFLV